MIVLVLFENNSLYNSGFERYSFKACVGGKFIRSCSIKVRRLITCTFNTQSLQTKTHIRANFTVVKLGYFKCHHRYMLFLQL